MIIDLKHPVERSENLGLLSTILEAMIGQPCLKITPTYGDEVVIHLGPPVHYHSKRMAGKSHGAWRLRTRASLWRAVLPEYGVAVVSPEFTDCYAQLATIDVPPEELWARVNGSLAGQLLIGISPTFLSQLEPPCQPQVPDLPHAEQPHAKLPLGAVLFFQNGATFRLLPSSEADPRDIPGEPVADWELFTPFGMYLRVGPGRSWSYLASDVAAKVG